MNKFKKVYFLGMEILHSDKGIIMHQLKYKLEILRFELMNCKYVVTPLEINHMLDSDSDSDGDGDNVDAITFT